MLISDFEITDQRNIGLAACRAVPRVMILTGPNGCGKSTLLQALRNVSRGIRPMYIGPHRASRRQRVRFRFLGPEIRMGSVLAGDELPGYEGIRNITTRRTPWDQDDAASFLKFGLCQIELDRREAIARRYEQAGEIAKNSIPDVWQPLREMVENLLPHLTFEKIDTSNRDEIKCLWKVSESSTVIDLDDLSSGEKSIIQTFFPLVEHRIRHVLDQLRDQAYQKTAESICVLIDEPELHLHPNLQVGILDYFRQLSIGENAQFVIATHSPTIVEYSSSDELYLLRPKDMVEPGENQLIQIATNEEKLRLLKDVFGSTSNLTAMRPILVVEGKREDKQSKRAADARIYTLLSEEFSRITIMPAGGKTECRALARSLSSLLPGFSGQLRAYALLDRDLEDETPEQTDEHLLPVSMIENLLVDPKVIWKATELVHHKMALQNEQDVENAIDDVLDEFTDAEVARRIKSEVGAHIFRLSDPIESAADQVSQFIDELRSDLSESKFASLRTKGREIVACIERECRRREFFHGKKVLDRFYNLHLHDTGMSKEIFIYECARCARERRSVQSFVQEIMNSLGFVVSEQGEDV